MTTLTLAAADLAHLAFAVDRLPVDDNGMATDDYEAAQRIARALRETSEHYSSASVHIEIELDESAYIGPDVATARQPSDLSLALELAERFLEEGELADSPPEERARYEAAIERLKATTPELAQSTIS